MGLPMSCSISGGRCLVVVVVVEEEEEEEGREVGRAIEEGGRGG